MSLPRLSKFTMESLLFVGLLLINHSCVLGNGSSFGVHNSRELSSSHYHNFSEKDTISNDVPNGSILTTHNNSGIQIKEGCQLPVRWQGKYFQHSSEVKIDGNSISGKGVCQESQGDKYLFVLPEEGETCYRCVVILQKHINILQYKESDCRGNDTLENLCDTITGDDALHTLFRINGKPEECPFRGGPFKFSYSLAGREECLWPESSVKTCSENWKLSFQYLACPTTISESKDEELHCLAHWQEGSTKYLVGTVNSQYREKLSERYRCFVFEEIRSVERSSASVRRSVTSGHTGISGYKLSQSGDASCSGMYSPTDGEVNFSLKVLEEEIPCKFPKWISASEWNTLDGEKTIKVQEKDTTLVVSERMHGNLSRTELIFPVLRTGTRVLCQKREDITQDQLTIVARSTKGCKSDKICLHLYKRSELIIEMQILTQSHGEENFDEHCANGSLSHLAGTSSPTLTLVNARAKTTECPFQGKFSVGGLTKYGEPIKNMCAEEGTKEELNSINIACKNPESFDILSKCNVVDEEPQEFQCVQHWNESDRGFLIVSNTMMPISSQNPSYCCSYKRLPYGYYVAVSGTSCERNLFASADILSTFNLTLEASCNKPQFVSSEARRKHCDTLLPILMVIMIFCKSFITSKILD